MRNPGPKPEPAHLFARAPLPVAALDDRGRLACLRLIRSENVGPATFRDLVNHCGGAEAALRALPDLARRGGRRRQVRICSEAEATAELEAAARAGARPLFTIEPGYPALLAQIEPPPPMLYVQGRVELLSRPAVAVVGSRECSAAGQRMARQIAGDLAAAGVLVVSGLARGIDGAAHEASLAGGTAAVLAGGVDFFYPPEHRDLQARIARDGVIATELPAGYEPKGRDFPRRNRIISGLSLGVVVIEAARRSGSLVTARYAAEQGRDVFAVPGHPLDPRAEGTNGLLKDGATIVTEARDILAALSPLAGGQGLGERVAAVEREPIAASLPPPLTGDEDRRRVLQALGAAPVSMETLQAETGLAARTLAVLLIELDLAGRIERHGGQLVSLSPDALPDT